MVSTVAVDMGVNDPTVPQIMDELPGASQIDRTGVNAWEDADNLRRILNWYFDTKRRLGLGEADILPSVGS